MRLKRDVGFNFLNVCAVFSRIETSVKSTGSAEELESRRRRAMGLLELGMSPTVVAIAVGTER